MTAVAAVCLGVLRMAMTMSSKERPADTIVAAAVLAQPFLVVLAIVLAMQYPNWGAKIVAVIAGLVAAGLLVLLVCMPGAVWAVLAGIPVIIGFAWVVRHFSPRNHDPPDGPPQA